MRGGERRLGFFLRVEHGDFRKIGGDFCKIVRRGRRASADCDVYRELARGGGQTGRSFNHSDSDSNVVEIIKSRDLNQWKSRYERINI